jgi:hypothetical protein
MRIPCDDVIYLLYHAYMEALDKDGNYAASEFADHLGVAHEKVAYDPEADEIVVADDVPPSLCELLEPEE